MHYLMHCMLCVRCSALWVLLMSALTPVPPVYRSVARMHTLHRCCIVSRVPALLLPAAPAPEPLLHWTLRCWPMPACATTSCVLGFS